MANSILSPNMSLPLPVIGVDPGPDWASNLNASLSILDGHNHASGAGVQITPAGLNINSDLTFLSNNALGLRSARFVSQNAPLALALDLSCIYVSNGNLYYNNGAGLQIQLTNSSGIAGTSGSIGNLVSPASVTFVSATGTYQFQSNSNVAGNIDAASIILRNQTAGSFGITLSPPTGLSSNYTLVLPPIPSQKSIATLDSGGNFGNILADNSTITYSGGTLMVPSGGIGSAQIAALGVGTGNVALGAIDLPQRATTPTIISTPVSGTYTSTGGTVVGLTMSTTGNFLTNGQPTLWIVSGTINLFNTDVTTGAGLKPTLSISLQDSAPTPNTIAQFSLSADGSLLGSLFYYVSGVLSPGSAVYPVPTNSLPGVTATNSLFTFSSTLKFYGPCSFNPTRLLIKVGASNQAVVSFLTVQGIQV